MPRKFAAASPSAEKHPRSLPSEQEFTEESLAFLRGLGRNNNRDWFEARRIVYLEALRKPMLRLIAAVNEQMESFAPLHLHPAEKIALRIYRDTRFSKNKLPYKQHYAAWWGRAGMEKTSGAGYYFHLSAKEVQIAAGVYMPNPQQMLLVRRHLLEHHERFRSLVDARALKGKMRLSEPRALTRAPKGFSVEHPAIDLILFRNWGVDAVLPAEIAIKKGFSKVLAGYFRAASPLVEFLNTPLLTHTSARRPILALDGM